MVVTLQQPVKAALCQVCGEHYNLGAWCEDALSYNMRALGVCDRCEWQLRPYRASTWRYHVKRLRRQRLGLGRPLADDFVDRLAVELADRPELFGPIVRALVAHAGDRDGAN